MYDDELLEVKNLSKIFKKNNIEFKAVDNVSLVLKSGECLGILGESGSGKTTLARIIAGIEKATEGSIFLNGKKLKDIENKDMKDRKEIQMIFQNPISSFNPRMLIEDYLYEPLRNYRKLSRKEALIEIRKNLIAVGLDETFLKKYPHELSGGELQRIVIARAIIVEPKIIICDEATSALDVTIQNQILNILEKLQKELKISYIFIGHDLATVQKISQKIIVMYKGKVVETLESKNLKKIAKHPYTRTLINAVYDVYEKR